MSEDNEYYINEIEENSNTKFIDFKLGVVADSLYEISKYFEKTVGDEYKQNIVEYVNETYKFEVLKEEDFNFGRAYNQFVSIIDQDEVLSEDYFNSILAQEDIRINFAQIYCMYNKEFIIDNLGSYDSDIDENMDYDDFEEIGVLVDLVNELKHYIFYGDDELLKKDIISLSNNLRDIDYEI